MGYLALSSSSKNKKHLQKIKDAQRKQDIQDGLGDPGYDYTLVLEEAAKEIPYPIELIKGTKEYITNVVKRRKKQQEYRDAVDATLGDNTLTAEDLLNEFIDFDILRAEIYFPRARLWDLNKRIYNQERLKNISETGLSNTQVQDIEENPFSFHFMQMKCLKGKTKISWEKSVQEIFSDEISLKGKLSFKPGQTKAETNVTSDEYNTELKNIQDILNLSQEQEEFEKIKNAVKRNSKIGRDEKGNVQAGALIDRYQFNLISRGEPKKRVAKILFDRDEEGRVLAAYFWYMLTANKYHLNKRLKNTGAMINHATVFEHYATKFVQPLDVFDGNDKRDIDEKLMQAIKRKMWPSAHYWAAIYGPIPEHNTPLRNDPKSLIKFLRRANALYELAKEYKIYRAMVKNSFKKELLFNYDLFKGDKNDIVVNDFTKEEMARIKSFKPRTRKQL